MFESFPTNVRGLIASALLIAGEYTLSNEQAEMYFELYDKINGKHKIYELRRYRRETQERIHG